MKDWYQITDTSLEDYQPTAITHYFNQKVKKEVSINTRKIITATGLEKPIFQQNAIPAAWSMNAECREMVNITITISFIQ